VATGWARRLAVFRRGDVPSTIIAGQMNRVIYASAWLLVTNTLAANSVATQMLTNAYSSDSSNRDELLADGWSFHREAGRRNCPQHRKSPTPPSVPSSPMTSPPGTLRIPCDIGDLYATGPYANNTRNSLFRSLPTNWVSTQLRLTFAPRPPRTISKSISDSTRTTTTTSAVGRQLQIPPTAR